MSDTYLQYVCKHSAMSQRSTLKRLHKVQIVTISVKIWLSSLKSHMPSSTSGCCSSGDC
jgi:hypothetical protein